MSKGVINAPRARWARQMSAIAELTAVPPETAAQKQARIACLRRDYRAFVEYYFPKYATFHCADFYIDAAKRHCIFCKGGAGNRPEGCADAEAAPTTSGG